MLNRRKAAPVAELLSFLDTAIIDLCNEEAISKKKGLKKMKDRSPNLYQKLMFRQPDFKINVEADITSYLAEIEQIFHEELEIKYFYEGTTTLMIGDNVIVAQPGDIIVVNPYEFHTTIDIGSCKGRYHLVNLSLDFLTDQNPKGLNLRHLLLKKGICFHNLIRGNTLLSQLLERIVEEMREEKKSYQLMVQCMVTEFFLLLLRDEVNEKKTDLVPEQNAEYYHMIEPVIQYINASYAQKITLDQMSAVSGMSKYHLCRVFRQSTGFTIMQYLLNYRLKIANVFLANTDKNIAEIAEACGFQDEGYFCRCYKKAYGISPKRNKAILLSK